MAKRFIVPSKVPLPSPAIAEAAAKLKLELDPPTVDFVSGSEGAEVYFKVIGLAALERNIMKLPAIAIDAAGYEMAQIAKEIIIDAQNNYVPFRFGHLFKSGDSDDYKPNQGAGITKIAMWFGGEVGPEGLEAGIQDVRAYALEQHENMEFHHDIGGPHYLEIPFWKAYPNVRPRIAAAIAKAMGMDTGAAIALLDKE